MSRIDQALAEFPADALTNKLLRSLFAAVPYSPKYDHVGSVAEAVRRLRPMATDADVARAQQLADTDPDLADVMWMGNVLDSADKGYAVVTGLFAAWNLFTGKGSAALENDSQQRNDAVLKALGLAYLAWKAFPGTIPERAAAFGASESGKFLATYFGSVEVALPFADNAVSMGRDGLSKLLTAESGSQLARLASLGGGKDLGAAGEMLGQLSGQLQKVTGTAAGYIKPVTAAIGPYLPGMNATDKAAGAVASAADVMPVYRVLAARLAAESAARRALGV